MVRYLLLACAITSFMGGGAGHAKTITIPAEQGRAQAVFSSGAVKPGDTVVLAPGNHGVLKIRGQVFRKPILLTSARNATAVFEELNIANSSGITIRRISVLSPQTLPKWAAAVTVKGSDHITFDQVNVRTAKSTRGWSAGAWRRKIRNGMRLSGSHITVSNSALQNVHHAITSEGPHARIENTSIELFSGDGIRGLGDNSVYRGNTIKTCVKIDDNHDDGFQSFSRGANGKSGKGVVKNVVVDGNLIVNGTHPLTCTLQGIGLFDGIYQNWQITNNVVIVDSWHGITVQGANRVKIIGNRVVDSRPGRPGPPRISILPHKDGRAPKRGEIRNNIMHTNKPNVDLTVSGVRRTGNHVLQTAQQALDLRKR